MQLGDWQGVQRPPFTDKILAVLGLDDYLTRCYYTRTATASDLYIGYWQSQRQGDTIHSPQNCLPGAGWEPVSQASADVPGSAQPGRRQPLTVNRYRDPEGRSTGSSCCIGTRAAGASSPASTGARSIWCSTPRATTAPTPRSFASSCPFAGERRGRSRRRKERRSSSSNVLCRNSETFLPN